MGHEPWPHCLLAGCRLSARPGVSPQFTYRESLRDIEARLRSGPDKLHHMGIRGRVSRSTLTDGKETHDWRIFAEFAQTLIVHARALYADEPFGVEIGHSAYALNSTTIDLCLAVFPWARFRAHKAALKMHALIDLRGRHSMPWRSAGTTLSVRVSSAVA